MINLTREVLIIKDGDELSQSIIRAIEQAKVCVRDGLFEGRPIQTEKISASDRNPLIRASIFKFFDGHDDPSCMPVYDSVWIKRLYSCCKITPSKNLVSSLLPVRPDGFSWLNRSYLMRFRVDAILLMHFLWAEGAALLPMDLKLPTTKDPLSGGMTFEYAAPMYPEVLALVRQPYVRHVHYQLPDISRIMPDTSLGAIVKSGVWRFKPHPVADLRFA